MNTESILKEYRKRRELLNNVNSKNAHIRIKAFFEYCTSTEKIDVIMGRHYRQYPTDSLLEGKGPKNPLNVGPLEEIVSIGLYLMIECSEGVALNDLAIRYGIEESGEMRTAENYVRAAMKQYIVPALDYFEDCIKQVVKTPDEKNDDIKKKVKKERELCLDFIGFLTKKKGYNRSNMIYGKRGNRAWIDLEIIDYVNKKQLAVVEFGLKEDYLSVQKAKNQLLEFNGNAPPPTSAYIVFPDDAGLGDEFNITKVDMRTDSTESMHSKDFPDYEELRIALSHDVPGEGFKNNEELRDAFKKFMVSKKGYPQESLSDVPYLGEDEYRPDCVTEANGVDGKLLALIGFCLERRDSNGVFDDIKECEKNRGANNILSYVVFTDKKQGVTFAILEHENDGETHKVLVEDFPDYEELSIAPVDKLTISDFSSKLTNKGNALFDKLIDLVKSDSLFVINITSSNYINIKIKKPSRVAFQIHRVIDNSKIELAIAIAGWEADNPEITNKIDLLKSSMEMLSGYNDSDFEDLWLKGSIKAKSKKEMPPHEAKVYLVNPPILRSEQALQELNKLLQWAKESTRKGKPKGGEKMLQAFSTGNHAVGDGETGKDSLGYAPYVEAVAYFLTHEDTRPPLTMSVEGEWGSGKSSFMLQLQEEIKRQYIEDESKGKCFIVEFDPWRHDKDDALWAAFALKFVKDIAKSLKWSEKFIANMSLKLTRYNWCEGWTDFAKVVGLTIIWLVVTGVLVSLVCKGVPLDKSGNIELPGWIGSMTVIAGALFVALGKVKDFLGNPLAVDLKKHMKKPDYVSKISFIDRFHKDFEKIVHSYVGDNRVYVFVDDLDRCEVPKAAELMGSINLMLSESKNLVFIMGMDREKVAAGLAVKHEKLLPYLSDAAIKSESDNKDKAKRLRGIRYGYAFIEKFIQIPFRLPKPGNDDIKNMLLAMVGKTEEDVEVKEVKPGKKEPSTKSVGIPKGIHSDQPKPEPAEVKEAVPSEEKKEAERAERQEVRQEVMLKFEGDDKNFRTVALMVSEAFGNNPRRVKQFVNLFRLRITTAASTGLITREERQFTFVQLGKICWHRIEVAIVYQSFRA